ncbi:hypothetical protein LP420_39185 [Massilia sp. B-10]|nr:hypothetical protein LP420_39185 [Massilia sp. B-10]
MLADNGLPSNYYEELVQPWAGSSLSNTDLQPWLSDVSQQIHINYQDPWIILPASFDTAVHHAYVVTERDTFSSFEVESTHSYPQAFYVIFDGYTPNELGGATCHGSASRRVHQRRRDCFHQRLEQPGRVRECGGGGYAAAHFVYLRSVFFGRQRFTFPGEKRIWCCARNWAARCAPLPSI